MGRQSSIIPPSSRQDSNSSCGSRVSSLSRQQQRALVDNAFNVVNQQLDLEQDGNELVQHAVQQIKKGMTSVKDESEFIDQKEELARQISNVNEVKQKLLNERENYKRGVDQVLSKIKKEQPLLSQRFATQKTGASQKSNPTFMGGQLAEMIARQAVKQSVLAQKKNIRAENHVVESLKKDLGYDMIAEAFTVNNKLSLNLEPQRKYTGKAGHSIIGGHQDGIAKPSTSQVIQLGLGTNGDRTLAETATANEIKFERTKMHALFNKDPTQRIDSDFKELRSILMSLDFIRDSELPFQAQDLSELAKEAQILPFEAGCRIIRQDSDADTMLFVVQGTALATYSLAAKNKQAIFMGRKDQAADGLVKTLKTLHTYGKEVARALGNHQEDNPETQSGKSTRSAVSRGSRRSSKSKMRHRSNSQRRTSRFFLTGCNGEDDQISQGSYAAAHRRSIQGRAANLKRLLNKMTDKHGERRRSEQRMADPLNQAVEQIADTFKWTESEQAFLNQYTCESQRPQSRATLGVPTFNLGQNKVGTSPRNLLTIGSSASDKKMSFNQLVPASSGNDTSSKDGNLKKPGMKLGGALFAGLRGKLATATNNTNANTNTNFAGLSVRSSVQDKSSKEEGDNKSQPPVVKSSMAAFLGNKIMSQQKPTIARADSVESEQYGGAKALQINSQPLSSVEERRKTGVYSLKEKLFSNLMPAPEKPANIYNSMAKIHNLGGGTASNKPGLIVGALSKVTSATSLKPKEPATTKASYLKTDHSHGDDGIVTNDGDGPYKTYSAVPKKMPKSGSQQFIGVSSLGGGDSQQQRLDTSTFNRLEDADMHNIDSQGMRSQSGSSQDSDSDQSCISDCHLSEISIVSRDKSGKPNEIEICKLESGQYCGAQVLTLGDSQPHIQQRRACSLYAVSARTCYILVLHKDKYRKAVEACKNRIKGEKLEFLKSVELISHFQRNSMKNLTKFLIKKRLNKSQLLFREGDRADRIFFVVKGEFKITLKIVIIDKKQEDNQQQKESVKNANTQRPNSSAFPLNKNRSKNGANGPTRKAGVLDLIIVTQRGVLGDEDVVLDAEHQEGGLINRHMTSCEAMNNDAEVYELRQDDFLREAKKQPFWPEIKTLIQTKRGKFAQRVIQKNEVQNDVDRSMTKHKKEQVTLEQQINQWTDINSNQAIVKRENSFKRLITQKIQGVASGSTQNGSGFIKRQVGLNKSLSKKHLGASQTLITDQSMSQLSIIEPLKMFNNTNSQSIIRQSSVENSFLPKSPPRNEFARADFLVKRREKHEKGRHNLSLRVKKEASMPNISFGQHTNEAQNTMMLQTGSNFMMPSYPGTTKHQRVASMGSQVLPNLSKLDGSKSYGHQANAAQNQQSEYFSSSSALEVNQITRFLPSDLKYGAMKHHTLSATLRAKENQRMMLRSGTLPAHELKNVDPGILLQEKRQLREKIGVLQDHELAMKSMKTLRTFSRKLQQDTRDSRLPGRQKLTRGNQGDKQPTAEDQSRAGFLLRQQQKAGGFEARGSYGHNIKRKDDRVAGVSALAQKLCANMVGQNMMFGGASKSKNKPSTSGIFVSNDQLRTVKTKLLKNKSSTDVRSVHFRDSGGPAAASNTAVVSQPSAVLSQARNSYYA